jgi:thymidylate synthase (FAD)|tara:strand:+ start:293 stop:988 length:696 start_codon:yes stop_codon:yes gene_type:complete
MDEVLEQNVLDHGKVTLRDSMADDLSVVNAARVSYATLVEEISPADAKLIHFLMRERHGTPFEHSVFKFFIKCPIFVAREWMRHRISSFNEMSMRYHVPDQVDFFIPDKTTVRSQIGKPGSYSFKSIEDDYLADDARSEMAALYDAAYESYNVLLNMGIAKEVARCVLPVGQYTEFIWTVNARSLMNFVSLRNDENAQFEIRQYAIAVEDIFKLLMPITYESFITNNRVAP